MAEFGVRDLVEHLKQAEGFRGEVYDDVGHPAVGFGHRAQPGEDFSGGVTEEQANQLLFQDLSAASSAARRAAEEVRPGTDWDATDFKTKAKLIERAYNMGPNFHRGEQGFPKWTAAVLDGDTETELAEYERFSDGKPLTGRNELYLKTFHGEPTGGGGGEQQEAEAPPSLEDVVTSKEFRESSPAQQMETLSAASPQFRELLEKDPETAKAWAAEKAEQADPSLLDSIEGGFQMGVGIAQLSAANAAMLIENLGIENDFDDSWRAAADLNFIDAENKIGSDWYDIVASVVAGVPGGMVVPGIATAAAAYGLPMLGLGAGATAALSMPVGFASAGALSAADRGWWEAGKRGVIEGALGAIYPATAHLNRLSRMGLESTAAFLVSEQPDPVRRAIEAGSIGVLAGTPKKRAPYEVMQKLGMRDRFAEQRLAFKEARRQHDAHVRSHQAASDLAVVADDGTPLGSLLDLQKDWAETVKAEHPMTTPRPEDRPMHERIASEVARKGQDPPSPEPVKPGTTKGDKSATFDPGRSHVDNRVFSIDEDYVEPLLQRKFKGAGTIMADFAEAFRIPIKGDIGQGMRLKGARGWYRPVTRALHLQSRRNVQTGAHEAGHDMSFEFPELMRLHMGKEFSADLKRVKSVAEMADARLSDGGEVTIGTFRDLAEKNALPEDLKYIHELLEVSYDKSNPTEGVAELFRLWSTNNRKYGGDVDLTKTAPNATKALEDWKAALPRKQRKAMERFQKDAHEHLALHGEAASMTAIGPDGNPEAALFNRMARFRQSYFDDAAGAQAFEIEMFGQIIPGGFSETLHLLRGTAEASEKMMFHGAPTWIPDPKTGESMLRFEGESIADIIAKHGFKRGRALDRALRYAVGLQANELKKQARTRKGNIVDLKNLSPDERRFYELHNETREKLLSQEEIDAMLKPGRDDPRYRAFADDLIAFADRMVKFGEGAGLWNKQQQAGWRRKLFMFSFLREMGEQRGGGGTNMMQGERPTRMLRGSTRNLREPFTLLMDTHTRTFKLAMENIAKRKLIRAVKNMKGGGRYGEVLREIPDIKDVNLADVRAAAKTEIRKLAPNIPEDQIEAYLRENFKIADDLETVSMFFGTHQPRGPNVMSVLENGKMKHLQVTDPGLVRSIQAMRRPALMGIEKYWNAARRFKQTFITRAPGFITANFVRDVAMASIMSKTGNFHLGKAMKGLWGAIKHDQDYLDLIANGGGAAGLGESHASIRRKMLRHAQRTGFNPGRLLIDAASVHRFLAEASRVTEIASRLGEYKAARKMGHRASHAAYLAREVSTDFGTRGDNRSINFMSNTIPFFNAMLASGDRLYRSMAMDPSHRVATAVKMGLTAMAGVALYGVNRQIPQYNDLPEWDKLGYLHFFLPSWTDDGERKRVESGRFAGMLDYEHFKMPKLWEVGTLTSLGELFMGSLLGSEDDEDQNLALDALQMIASNYGINLFDDAYPFPMPAGMDIVVEQIANKVLRTGNPIESQGVATYEAWARTRKSGAQVMTEWGKFMKDYPSMPDSIRSPARAEALLRGLFGEFATMGIALAESVYFPDGPATPIDRQPVVSRFYEGPEKYSRVERDFWERYQSVNEISSTQRMLASKPDRVDEAMSLAQDQERMRMVGLDRAYGHAAEQIRTFEKYIELLKTGALGYTPAEARKEIDKTKSEIRTLMASMVETDKQIRKAAKDAEANPRVEPHRGR